MRTTIVASSVLQLRIDYEQAKKLPTRVSIHSDTVSVGGHLWRIQCYPRGYHGDDKGEYLSIFLAHMSNTRSAKAILDVFLVDKDGKPSVKEERRFLHTFQCSKVRQSSGWPQFVKWTTLEKDYLADGHITIICAIMVTDDSPIPVPPSDIGTHLGSLLDRTDGTDVTYIVDGETFHAHRAVLAARSPFFRAELFGSMAEATMPCITLHEIAPATFKVMLRFMYHDALPGEEELGDSSIEMFENLLAAADRYALDRLKLICAQKLWDKVSVDTVSTVLACPETNNCPELKNKCIDFFVVEENFKEVMFTDSYGILLLKFPSVIAELRKRALWDMNCLYLMTWDPDLSESCSSCSVALSAADQFG